MKYLKLFESFISEKVIFLDIDGVINIIREDSGFDEYGQLFNQRCVDNLKKIIDSTNAQIVISSTWKDSGLTIMKEMWDYRELPGNVIDITPSAQEVVEAGIEEFYDLVSRGSEISLWISKNNFKGKYIILDDVRDFTTDQLPHFIKTNADIGISDTDVIKSVYLLS